MPVIKMLFSRHMNFSQRKALCLLILFYRELGHRRSYFFSIQAEPQYNRLLRILNDIATDEINFPVNALRLHEFIDKSIERFLDEGKSIKGIDRNLVERVAEKIRKDAEGISCNECEKHCTGDIDDDDKIVAETGKCIKHLRDIFHLTLEVADRYYSTYSTTEIPKPIVSLSTAFKKRKPHKIPARIYASGVTIFRYDKAVNSPISEVEIQFCLKRFDWRTYLALPYIFLHEIICHAFQNVLSWPKEKRRNSGPNDMFSEGWMDWITYKILEEVKNGIGPAKSLRKEMPDLDKHLRAAYYLHQRRVDTDDENNRYDYSPYCAMGKAAASKLLELFCSLLSEEKGWERFLKTSFDLNMYPFPYERMDDFVTTIVKCINERDINIVEPPEIYITYHRIYQIIKNYLKKWDIDSFFNEMITLDQKPHS